MTENQIKNKNLMQGTIIYAIGSFGTKILSFLIVPLYTYYISTTDMGIYDLLNTTAGLLTPIITLQISDAAFRWMVREERSASVYVKATMQVLVLNSFIAAILIYIFSRFFPFPYSTEFILFLVTSRALATIQKLLRGFKNQRLFVISSMVYTVIFLALNVIQICILQKGVRSLFTSAIVANAIVLLFVFVFEKRLRLNYFSKPDKGIIQKMFRFSIPLVPNQLNWWVMNSSDRYIISYFLGAGINGVYSIAYKFPSMLQLVFGFFNTSWQDVSVADKDKNTGMYYTSVFRQLYTFSFSLLWVLVPITKLFIYVAMSTDYRNSANYISFLYLGTVFQSFSSFYGVGYLRDKNTKQASMTSIYGAVLNAVVHIALIQSIGLHAASFSTFVGFLVMWILRERQNRKELGITLNRTEFMLYFLITGVVCVLTCFSNFYMDCFIGVLGCIGFLGVNRNLIRQVLEKILKKKGTSVKHNFDI